MILTSKVKLQPAHDQYSALVATLTEANNACNYISDIAWGERLFNKFALQKRVYHNVKAFGLCAQISILCVMKVADAYKLDKDTKRTFKADGSIAYDSRVLSWKLDQREVSIWTVDGRLKVPFVAHDRALTLLSGNRGQSDLCLIDGDFYLFTSCEVDEPEPQDVKEYMGVDMGVKNIATDSDGNNYSGSHVNNLRARNAKLKARLQSKGTKSTKRLLKKRRRKEVRFAKNENHRIAKELVERAKDTGRGIAVEDLTGIRERVTVRRSQRRQHHSWSFHDLRMKIEYKAKLHGIPFKTVDPRNTSRTCPCCGCIDKRNRPKQESFSCVQCGFSGFADHIAAVNIGRAAVIQPYVSDATQGWFQPTLVVL